MKKVPTIIVLVLLSLYFFATIGLYVYARLNEPSTYEEAGTDYTKSFNRERRKLKLPVIPNNWYNVNPIDSRVQTWENPDRLMPSHAEKTVVAGREAYIEKESDRYNLDRLGDYYFQVVVEYDFSSNSWVYTTRLTPDPQPNPYIGGSRSSRYQGEILDTLNLKQAIDTLRYHGLERLNY